MEDSFPVNDFCITVLFHGEIKELQISFNGAERELTCRDVLKECIKHIQENRVCVSSKKSEMFGPKYLPAFGLVVYPSANIWLPHNHKFKKTTETEKRKYKFRVRFHLPAERLMDNTILTEYLILQTLDDFLTGPLGELSNKQEVTDVTMFGLLVIAFLMPQTLPLDSDAVVDKKWKSRQCSMWNFTDKLSKSLIKRFISQKFVDRLFIHQALKKGIRRHKENPQPQKLGYFKHYFYKILTEAIPTSLLEEYKATSIGMGVGEKDEVVTLNIGFCGVKEPALYYGEVLQCSIREIFTMKLIKPVNREGRSWHVEIHTEGGPPKVLEFEEEGAAESFISMTQGYLNLYVDYDVCINKELQTWQPRVSNKLCSFGPISKETAQDYLDSSRKAGDVGSFVYLIHESMTAFDHYVVMYSSGRERENGFPVGRKSLEYKTLDLHCLSETDFQLSTEDGVKTFESSLELRKHLKKLGQQIYPRYYPVIAEINEDYRGELDYYTSPNTQEPSDGQHVHGHTEQELPMPLAIIKDDLKDKKEIPFDFVCPSERLDKVPLVRKYEVYLNSERMMLVQLQSNKGKFSRSFREGLEKLLKLSRIKPSNFLKFYNTIVESQFSVLMEFPPKGDLLTHLCTHKNRVAQKVHIMYQIVKTLGVMERNKLYHGNIRCRKFMVFYGEEADFVTIKLGDPGIVSHRDTLPLNQLDNIERMPWLSPERRKNLNHITYESECYAVGTALCEILYRSDDFHTELQLGNKTLLDYFSDNKNLPRPPLITDRNPMTNTGHDKDHVLLPEAREVLESVWNDIILKCWAADEMERPTVTTLLSEFSGLQRKASDIVGDTPLEELKKVAYHMGFKGDDIKTDNRPVTIDELGKRLSSWTKEKFLVHNCIKINYDEELGKGYFGAVWKAQICPPRMNKDLDTGPWTTVAVKRMNTLRSVDARFFIKEVLIAIDLKHPNIVKVLHFSNDRHKDKNYTNLMLIMEFMNGGSLTNYASKYGSLRSHEQVLHMLKICLDVAEGMVYLSGKAIVHRDLAARNILLSKHSDGSVTAKVSDFGLARSMEGNYRFYKVKKTEELPFFWMPPECLVFEDSDEGHFRSSGDVWSFGIMMWEAFSEGRHPKTEMRLGKTNAAEKLLAMYERDNWRLPQGDKTSRGIYDIMLKCWQFEERDRPPFVELVQMFKHIIQQTKQS